MENKAFDYSHYADWCDPNEVIPYTKNAKTHTEKQIRNIANSIKRFGWQQDTVITRDNVLVIGHGRRLAAIQLGCMIPFHVINKNADELTDEDIRELRIADNATNAETGINFQVLEDEIGDLTFEGFEFDFTKNTDDGQRIEADDIETNPVLTLPKSRLMLLCVSAFGTESECFLAVGLTESEAERFLEKTKDQKTADIAEKLKVALNDL